MLFPPPPLRSAAVVRSECVYERRPPAVAVGSVSGRGGEGGGALLGTPSGWLADMSASSRSNSNALESGEKYILNEDGSELTIKDVKKVDEGDYACIAKNKAGTKTEQVSLNVFGRR